MLTLQNVTLIRGAKTLIENINFAVFDKNIIGIVGANGSGKSSLFAAINGDLEIAKGNIELRKNARVNHLDQEVPGLAISALNYVISSDTELFAVLEQLEKAEHQQNYDIIIECHNKLHELDGYSAEAKAAKILIGLGFSQEQLTEPVKNFSGGWRMRLNLAKCLYAPSDLLLLDEPTNHLDMEAIIWLEEFLRHFPGAILLVSHDRDFLDHTTTHILHIENHQAKLYTGDYSTFEVIRAQQIALQKAQFRKQQAQISHLMDFVNRFRAKASKAKQAQSRLKTIAKMQLVQSVYESSPFHFHFMQPNRMPNPMITMRKVDLGYSEKTVLKKINLNIMSGERIGLLGINGAGKSTLIKALCGELKQQHGVIERSPSLVVGYFAQHQLDYLPLNESPMSILKERWPTITEKEFTAYLGGFGFARDQALSPLKNFSGGEKARVALAIIIYQKPNLLLLDEPTNHLDLEVRQALMIALQEYEGTMILVSHDRYLLRTLVDELYLISNGKVEPFTGSVEDYYSIATQ
jgi:ATP-binding cassette subfamily F protein 3